MKHLFLQKTMLFRGMLPEETEQAARALRVRVRHYARETAILRAGAPTEWMGMVLRGGATVESNDLWGNRVLLSHVGEGQYFAETYAILEKETVPVDVIASEDSDVAFFNMVPLRTENGISAAWKTKLIGNLLVISAQKNLLLSARSFHTAPKQIRGRVMAYLNTVSLKKGARSFDIPFDRQQLADYLNVERTALSKELGRMRREGLIDFSRSRFVLRGDGD